MIQNKENSPSQEPVEPTKVERMKAILGTLKSNRDVQIDAGFAGGSFVLGTLYGEPILGLVMAGFSTSLRHGLALQEWLNTAHKAVKVKANSYTQRDLRYGPRILQEAWTTGQVQSTRTNKVNIPL